MLNCALLLSPDKALPGLKVAAAARPGGPLLKLAMSAFVVRGLDEDALAGRLLESTTAGLGLAEGALAGRLLLEREASACTNLASRGLIRIVETHCNRKLVNMLLSL